MSLWYLARGAGLIAVLMLSISTALGAWTSGRRPGGEGEVQARRFTLQRIHLAAAFTGLLLLVVHVLAIVLDSASGVWAGAAIIPMTSAYRPVAISLGVLAMYALVLVATIGAARGRMAASPLAARAWRMTHAVAYGAWALAVAHGIFAGSDATSRWVLVLNAVCVAMVVGALGRRLRSEDAHQRSPLVRSRRMQRSLAAGRVR
jgi:sulfoxide reductase heme-binding subunit YedZ